MEWHRTKQGGTVGLLNHVKRMVCLGYTDAIRSISMVALLPHTPKSDLLIFTDESKVKEGTGAGVVSQQRGSA